MKSPFENQPTDKKEFVNNIFSFIMNDSFVYLNGPGLFPLLRRDLELLRSTDFISSNLPKAINSHLEKEAGFSGVFDCCDDLKGIIRQLAIELAEFN